MGDMPRRTWSLVVVLSSLGMLLAGCADSYCQSGAKYGTQCYDVPHSNGTAQPRDAMTRPSDPPQTPPGNGTPATTPR
jgi:hypothetical protein